MQKRKHYLSTTILAVVLCIGAGCSREETPGEVNSGGALGINAYIRGISSDVSTRSVVTGESFNDNSTIGIFIDGDGYTSTAVTYTYSDGSWSSSNSIYLTKSSATVYGFYPSDLTPAMDGTSSTVPLEISSAITGFDVSGNTQTDYMYATVSGITKSNSTASLTFYHGLTELSFIINKGSEFSGSGTLTGITLTSSGSSIAGSGTLSLADGTVSLTGSASATISLTGTTTLNEYSETASSNVVAALLAAPLGLSSSDNVTLVLTIDGVEYTGTISAPAWEAGNNYEYRITMSGGELIIDSSVNIADWTTTGPTDVDVN